MINSMHMQSFITVATLVANGIDQLVRVLALLHRLMPVMPALGRYQQKKLKSRDFVGYTAS